MDRRMLDSLRRALALVAERKIRELELLAMDNPAVRYERELVALWRWRGRLEYPAERRA